MARTRDLDARDRILRATRSVIADHGPAGASMGEIARSAGVGRQTIYRWWPSRFALVLDAVVAVTDDRMGFVDTGDFLGDLRRQMLSMIEVFNSDTGALIKEVIAAAQRTPSDAADLRTRLFEHRRAQATAFFELAVERGQLAPPDDLEGVLAALYAPLWLALVANPEPVSARLVDRSIRTALRMG